MPVLNPPGELLAEIVLGLVNLVQLMFLFFLRRETLAVKEDVHALPDTIANGERQP